VDEEAAYLMAARKKGRRIQEGLGQDIASPGHRRRSLGSDILQIGSTSDLSFIIS
jgi:hypothetical protein